MDDILKYAEIISRKTADSKEHIPAFYKNFCSYNLKNRHDETFLYECILPPVYRLINENVIKKDLLFLTIIAYKNDNLLENILNYDKLIYKFNIDDPNSYYEFCIYKKYHWFVEILKNYKNVNTHFSPSIYNKIVLLKLLELTNRMQVNHEEIEILLELVKSDELEEFWEFYLNEIKRSVSIMKYSEKVSPELDRTKIFNHSINNPILDTFSKFIQFKTTDQEDILTQIREEEIRYEEGNSSQSKVFTGFMILTNIFNIIVPNEKIYGNSINFEIENLKNKLLNIEHKKYQIELLENIFAIIFLNDTHLFKNKEEEHICKEKEVRTILYLLKSVLDEIKLKNLYEKDSREYSRYVNLSKFVTDATWRLELLVNVKSLEKCEDNLLKYMLASPETLIQMCLKRGDFDRAYQVITIFNMEKSLLASQIKHTENINELKQTLKKIFKMKSIKKKSPNITVSNFELSVNKSIEDFVSKNAAFKSDPDNEIFMDILDLAITQPKTIEDCDIIFELARKYELKILDTNFSTFYAKIDTIYKKIGSENNLTISDILLDSNYGLLYEKYEKELQFFSELTESYKEFNDCLNVQEPGILNNNHLSHKALLKLNKVCSEYTSAPNENTKYLSKLFNYIKAFSRVLYIEQNTSNIVSCGRNTSYFELLNYNRSELMGKLLFEKDLDPSEFEKYFGKLKLDYLYHVIGNCFPTINLHSHENITKDELYPENNLYIPSKSIITYIQKRNWLLAFLLNEMYKIEDVKIDISEVRVKAFLNCLKLPNAQHLKVLFNDNDIIAVLQNDISTTKLTNYIHQQILLHENLSTSHHSHVSCDSFETGEEILEDVFKSTNWKALYDIVDSIPDTQMQKNSEFIDVKDMILMNIIQEAFEVGYYKNIELISNNELRINTFLSNFKKWPGDFCVSVIKSELTRFDKIPSIKLIELTDWLYEVELCEQLKPILGLPTWSKCYETCKNNSAEVISCLIASNKLDLLLKYIHLNQLDEEILQLINEDYLLKIFDSSLDFSKIKTLFDNLPFQHTIAVCRSLLKLLRKIDHLQFVTKYLLCNIEDEYLKYVEVSLKMLTVFSSTEQDQLLCLLPEPLNIVEILIMNTKLEQLENVLTILKNEMVHYEFHESKLSIEKVDELLKKYAEKSLDFRVIAQPNPRLLRTPECKLMQSLDSLNIGPDAKPFVMPIEVPLKDEWVQNNEVIECMCCKEVIFSMFNRRHHCRRCGRVICYNCSLKRMLVESYGDIMVRVCSDCYKQTFGEGSEFNDSISTKSINYDYWLLSDDEEHNKIVRDEFSYEHAPSVSLCLSLMKYHSKNIEYPKFLLDQCNLMLGLLIPSQEPMQEIDYLLVIKMLKSLAIAAKMSSVECTLQYGTSLADRILSQAELLGLLAERGCLNMLPINAAAIQAQGPYIDASVLRRLRDKLLEKEQWNLALEVSTKAGLDNSGIFAAWGKSCLKAGCLSLAREKFQRCLEKSSFYENSMECAVQSDDSSDTTVGRSRYTSKYSNISNLSENRQVKNPPLLNEIIQILESKTAPMCMEMLQSIETLKLSSSMLSLNQSFTAPTSPEPAISILNKLRNLKSIADGNYFQCAESSVQIKANSRKIDPVFYNECIHYLKKYGSHISLLEFYIRHGEISSALNYIIEFRLNADIFIEMYMRCLKDGIVNIMQENMSKIDSTLDIWKEYLRQICRHLEKQNLLHSLYQLQQYMGDYNRAALTCIKFYKENADNFTDLAAKVNFLHKAEEHFRQVLEQEQWVEVATVPGLSSESKDRFEEKGLANSSLVMIINPKYIDKYINTIWRQNEIVKFLSDCESLGVKPMEYLLDIMPKESLDSTVKKQISIPTLFDGIAEKIALAVLVIISGQSVEEGFKIVLRIIDEFKLKPIKVYCEAGKQLAKQEKYSLIAQLVSCIKNSGTKDNIVTEMCDEMLTLAVATLTKANVTGTKVEDLIKLISDRATKISAYIEAKQLKTAYFLAVKYKRMSDIRRILREAELLNQPNIKTLCLKVLHSHSHAPSQSNE